MRVLPASEARKIEQYKNVFPICSTVGLLKQLNGCDPFIVVFTFSDIAVNYVQFLSYSHEYVFFWCVHLITSVFLRATEDGTIVSLDVLVPAKIITLTNGTEIHSFFVTFLYASPSETRQLMPQFTLHYTTDLLFSFASSIW